MFFTSLEYDRIVDNFNTKKFKDALRFENVKLFDELEGAYGIDESLSWLYGNEKQDKDSKILLKEAKKEIINILKKYDCKLRPIDMNTIGLVNEEFVVNQVIENVERL